MLKSTNSSELAAHNSVFLCSYVSIHMFPILAKQVSIFPFLAKQVSLIPLCSTLSVYNLLRSTPVKQRCGPTKGSLIKSSVYPPTFLEKRLLCRRDGLMKSSVYPLTFLNSDVLLRAQKGLMTFTAICLLTFGFLLQHTPGYPSPTDSFLEAHSSLFS